MKLLTKLIVSLIESGKLLGLEETVIESAKEFLHYHEYGLAFDTIIGQLYENDIKIDFDFYRFLESIAHKMKLEGKEYLYMKELIRDDQILPEDIRDYQASLLADD